MSICDFFFPQPADESRFARVEGDNIVHYDVCVPEGRRLPPGFDVNAFRYVGRGTIVVLAGNYFPGKGIYDFYEKRDA